MQHLLTQLQQTFPGLQFTIGQDFVWSPETNQVFYSTAKTGKRAQWSLLHETGHALLKHQTYRTDIELLKLEVAAWEKARELAILFGITIDENHIEDCLDTYRDWLNARSICPTCTTKSLQLDNPSYYRCHNCHTSWNVTPARFARPYRSINAAAESAILL